MEKSNSYRLVEMTSPLLLPPALHMLAVTVMKGVTASYFGTSQRTDIMVLSSLLTLHGGSKRHYLWPVNG